MKKPLAIVLVVLVAPLTWLAHSQPTGFGGRSVSNRTATAPVTGSESPARGPARAPAPPLTPALPSRPSAGRTLVILSSPAERKVIPEIEEDLNVMTRILEKTTLSQSPPAPPRKLGVVLHSFDSDRPQALYLEGYGALFLLRTSMPLLGPPATNPPPAEPARDHTWENTRRELYGGPGASARGEPGGEPGPRYDEQLVAALKSQLLDALENASNIRHLKPDEYVTVTVLGAPGTPTETAPGATAAQPGSRGGFSGGAVQGESFAYGFSGGGSGRSGFGGGGFAGPASSSPGTILTVRVKKADADAVTVGKLSKPEFQKKAEVQVYAGNAPGAGSGEFMTWGDSY